MSNMGEKLNKNEMDELREFVEKLVATNGNDITLIELFGSAARGRLSEDSDLDVLVVTEGNRLRLMEEVAGIVSKSLLEYGRYISAKVFDEGQYRYFKEIGTPFMKNIEREGRVLWKKG